MSQKCSRRRHEGSGLTATRSEDGRSARGIEHGLTFFCHHVVLCANGSLPHLHKVRTVNDFHNLSDRNADRNAGIEIDILGRLQFAVMSGWPINSFAYWPL